VSSAFGNDLRLVNPWGTADVEVRTCEGDKAIAVDIEGGVLAFETEKNTAYYVTPAGKDPVRTNYRSTPNTGPKRKGHAIIGKARDFNLTERLR
jgi:hypothetical protein